MLESTVGRGGLLRRRVCLALLACLAVWTGEGRTAESMLIPGADLSQLEVKKGAWCRYRVVDEALGQEDSTEVYVGIPSLEAAEKGPAFWLEISTKPLNAAGSEAQVLKLLLLESVKGISEGDSLGRYVVRLYIKKGDEPAEETDPDEYEDLSLVVPTAETAWTSSPGVPVEAAGRTFECVKKSRTVADDQVIPTGKVKLIKKSRDEYAVWFCSDVPVFHLARCVIERRRNTETDPPISGIPISGEKYSKTTAELTGFGYDAEPILTIEAPTR